MPSRFANPNVNKIFGDPAKGELAPVTSAAASLYSRVMRLPRSGGRAGAHIVWEATGVPVGNFEVYYSLLPQPDETTDTDWVQDTGATFIGGGVASGGAAGKRIIMISDLPPGGYWRIKWARGSGDITIYGYSTEDERA